MTPDRTHTPNFFIGLLTGLALALITLILLDLNGGPSDPPLADAGGARPEMTRPTPDLQSRASGSADPLPGADLTGRAPPESGIPMSHPAVLRFGNSNLAAENRPSEPDLKPEYARITALIGQNRDPEAAAMLAQLIREHPAEIQAYGLLAELHYKNDNLAEAISSWEKMLAIDPFNETARARLAKAKREDKTHEGFTQEVTRHFRIKFEGHENRHLYKTVLEFMEEAYAEVGKSLSYYPNEEIIIFLYTRRQFFDVTRAPAWSGGIFDGKIRIPTGGYESQLRRLRRVLFHEYTHAAIHQMTEKGLSRVSRKSVSAVPTWVHEGIAQYLEPDGARSRTNKTLKEWVRQGAFIELPRLHGSFMGFGNGAAALAYDESFSAIEFMVEEFGLYGLQRLLLALNEHPSFEEAMRDALFISYGEFQNRWEDDLRS